MTNSGDDDRLKLLVDDAIIAGQAAIIDPAVREAQQIVAEVAGKPVPVFGHPAQRRPKAAITRQLLAASLGSWLAPSSEVGQALG